MQPSQFMKALGWIVPIVVCGLSFSSGRAEAQRRLTVAVDATLGAGTGKGGEFYDRTLAGARIAASLRRSGQRRLGFFGEVAVDALSINSSHLSICYPAQDGGCLASYPDFWGPTVTGGLIVQPTERLEARLGAGGGVLIGSPTRVGAAIGQADVAFFPLSHIGLVAGARWVAVPRYRGDRLSILPWAIGLRLR